MTTTTKTTNKTALLYALENLPEAPAEVREKWQKMIDQLDKKNAAPAKMTAKQEANEGVKGEILDFLRDNAEGYTCSDLLKAIPSCEGKSNQYVSALMSQLFKSGAVEKYTDKRRTYFRIPAEVEG
jgi:hypothetical protein